jgi:serine/threonine protein kinase
MVLAGSYRILRQIGGGGFGITYAAEDIRLGTTVAVKEYYPDAFGDRDADLSVRPKSDRHRPTFDWGRASFIEEARTLARFQHSSIVRVSQIFEAHSTAYMVMDFERGENLESWLKRLEGRPSQADLDCIAAPLLDALEMIHAENSLAISRPTTSSSAPTVRPCCSILARRAVQSQNGAAPSQESSRRGTRRTSNMPQTAACRGLGRTSMRLAARSIAPLPVMRLRKRPSELLTIP